MTIAEFDVSATTDQQGKFTFAVKADKQTTVRIMAQKEGFVTHRQDVTLGNTGLSLQMERTP